METAASTDQNLILNPLEALLDRHDRERSAFRRLTEAEQARFQLKKLAQYQTTPWEFLRDCVYTLDQVDSVTPIKPFPSYLEYIQFLATVWEREKLIAIPKSRRLTCSWSCIALYTHEAMFKPGRFTAFVSKKEDDAGDLVSRAEFIYRHIPEWRIPSALLPKIKSGKMTKQPPVLEFEDINSKIQGVAMGADQLRQFTLSGIFGDECAFWDQAQKFYSASKPTLDGGGRMTLVSSRSPGFFKKIVFDKLDAQDLTFKEEPPVPVKSPMEGVEVWRNPINKFVVIDLHYTANPAKRGPQWREAVKQSMPLRDYLMEYEKSWQTYEGKPVYEDFNKTLHVVKGVIEPEPGIPLLLGWDFGLTPACILAQLVGSQLRILEEFIESDGSIKKLAPKVFNHLKINYANWLHADNFFSWADPAMSQRSQTDDAVTCAKVLRASGFNKLKPGPVAWEPRRQAVENFLIQISKAGPALVIAEDKCPILIEGFNGGYQYPEKAIDIEPGKIQPIKNKFSHPHDALQYLCAGALSVQKTYGTHKPTKEILPNYGFQKG